MTVQLHLRSCFSLLESTITIEKAIERAKLFNYNSLVISDLNTMHSYLKFNSLCKEANIQPIFALEIKYYIGDVFYPCFLYAKNNLGFYELIKISSRINNGFKFTLEQLQEYNNLILVLSSIENHFLNFEEDEQKKELGTLARNFDFYLALVNNDIPFNRKINEKYYNFKVRSLAFSECFYLDNDEISRISFCTALAIKNNKFIDDKVFNGYKNRYLKSDFEIS